MSLTENPRKVSGDIFSQEWVSIGCIVGTKSQLLFTVDTDKMLFATERVRVAECLAMFPDMIRFLRGLALEHFDTDVAKEVAAKFLAVVDGEAVPQ